MRTVHITAFAGALAFALVFGGCARGRDDQAAYDICLAAAKKDPKYAKAAFTDREGTNIQGSTGDAGIRVNIPYELEDKKGLYQCIVEKQTDGTYKVAF